MGETKGKNTGDESPAQPKASWHAMGLSACIKEMGLDENVTSTGLTSAQAAQRLEKYGPNRMTEGKKEDTLGEDLGSSCQLIGPSSCDYCSFRHLCSRCRFNKR